MQKLLSFILFTTCFLSCKESAVPEQTAQIETVFFTFQDMPEKQSINPAAKQILDAWQTFQEFESSLEVMYRAKNNEDLALAVDDLLAKEKALRADTYPSEFDKPQIKSRQRIVQTFLLKIKASIKDQTDVEEPMKQMLMANNALRKQFNVVINNKLDVKLILDEE